MSLGPKNLDSQFWGGKSQIISAIPAPLSQSLSFVNGFFGEMPELRSYDTK